VDSIVYGGTSSIALGAADNGSGATGVLVAADIVSGYRFERTVKFIFFTGEEELLLRAWHYARADRLPGHPGH
jgi:Zn-dependent M28 family amino/carboxypeptidase